jgi:hypothetical protein
MIVVNGVQEAVFTRVNGVSAILNQIGSASASTTAQLQGQIAEIIAFSSELSLSDCLQLSSNINSKYAIY